MTPHDPGPSSSSGGRGGQGGLRVERSPTLASRPSPPRRRPTTPEGPRRFRGAPVHFQHNQYHRGSSHPHNHGGPSWRHPSSSASQPPAPSGVNPLGPSSSRTFQRYSDRGAPSGPRHGPNRCHPRHGPSSFSSSSGNYPAAAPDWRADADRARARREQAARQGDAGSRHRDSYRDRGGASSRSSTRNSASPARTYASVEDDDEDDDNQDGPRDVRGRSGIKRRRERDSSRSRSTSRARGRSRSRSRSRSDSMTPSRGYARSRSRSSSTSRPPGPRSPPRSPRTLASRFQDRRRSRSPGREGSSIPSGPRDWRRRDSHRNREREWERARDRDRDGDRHRDRTRDSVRDRSLDVVAPRPSSRLRDRESDHDAIDPPARSDRRRAYTPERQRPPRTPPPLPSSSRPEENVGSADTVLGASASAGRRRWTDEEWEAERARRKADEAANAGAGAGGSVTRRRTSGRDWDRDGENGASGGSGTDVGKRGVTSPDPRSLKIGLGNGGSRAGALSTTAATTAAQGSTSSPLDVLSRPSRTARLEAAPPASHDMLSYGSGSSDSGDDEARRKGSGRSSVVKRPSTPNRLDQGEGTKPSYEPRVLPRRISDARISSGPRSASDRTPGTPPRDQKMDATIASESQHQQQKQQQPRKHGWHVVHPGDPKNGEMEKDQNKDKGTPTTTTSGPSAAMQAAMEAAMGGLSSSSAADPVAHPSSPEVKPKADPDPTSSPTESPLPLSVLSSRAAPGEAYDRISQVGEGTYGQVFKAKARSSSVLVALKKIRMESEKDGFPVTAMREIKLLQSLRHPNVVRLLEMMVSKGSAYMVFEYLEHDLNGLLSHPDLHFTPSHLKSLAHQLLSALDYLHHKSVLHRDLKGSNVLLSNDGVLKLADFGLARFYMKRRKGDYTNRVVTLWYRPPELLLGATQYGPEVDMWGAGCIFLELFTRKPVFQGHDEIDQVAVLVDALGPISTSTWPGVAQLPWFQLAQPGQEEEGEGVGEGDKEKDQDVEMRRVEEVRDMDGNASGEGNATGRAQSPAYYSRRFREPLQDLMTPAALDVAQSLLTYDPLLRSSASSALSMPYFTQETPKPQRPAGVLRGLEGEWHEFEARRARKGRTGKSGSNSVAATGGGEGEGGE